MTPTARTLRFEVPGVPVAQPRPRATVRGGHATVYGAPSKHPVNVFKAAVQLAASNAGAVPTYRPCAMTVTFWFPRPKSMTWKKRDMPAMPCVKKPDCDNLIKSVCDALNSIAYVDDSQVVRVVIEKWICAGSESPRCEVEIEYGDASCPT